MNTSEMKADALIVTLQALYGKLFIDSMKGLTLTQVKNVAVGIIGTLSDDQFNRGMAMLNAKAGQGGFCPTLAEFKTWCMSGSWWSVDEAWKRACDYSNLTSERIATLSAMSPEEFMKQREKITVLAKKAWDVVYWAVEQGNTKEAHRQFKTIYETYLAKAQMQGRSQEWYVPPVMIETKSKAVAVETKPKLSDQHQKIMARMNELLKSGLSRKQAFDQAQVDVRGEVKAIWGSVA